MPAREILLPTGKTGLDQFQGVIRDDILPELAGAEGRKRLRFMREQDPVVGAILFAIEMLMRNVDWSVNPADDSAEAEAQAQFVEECRTDMSVSWADLMSDIVSFMPFGWAWFETIYKLRGGDTDNGRTRSRYDDGKLGWRKFDIRAQETLARWEFDEDGGIAAMVQQPPPSYQQIVIPIERSLLFRTSAARGNPEGRSVLRNAYRPWYYKSRIENIEGIGIERDLAGLPVAIVPAEMLASDAGEKERLALETIRTVLRNIRRDEQEGIIFPGEWEDGHNIFELKLLSTGGTRQFDTDKTISRYDQRIAMTLLADFILLGHETVGSFALSSNKTALFSMAIGAFLDHIAAVFNQHAIPRLLRLNGMDTSLTPELAHGDIEDTDLGQLGTYLQALGAAGFPLFPNPDLEQHLMDVAGLPAPVAASEDAPQPPQKAPQAPPQDAQAQDATPPTDNAGAGAQRAEGQQATKAAAEDEQRLPFAGSGARADSRAFFNPLHSAKDGRFAKGSGVGAEGAPRWRPGAEGEWVKVFYNPNHSAKDGRFTRSSGGAVGKVDHRHDSSARLDALFGRHMDDNDVHALVAAPDGSRIFVGVRRGEVAISVYNDALPDFSMERRVRKNAAGDLEMENFLFTLGNRAPAGTGTKLFAEQVQNARLLGVKRMVTHAKGGVGAGRDWNGHYTWPRLGYDAPIPDAAKARLGPDFASASRVSDLMKTPEGRAAWKEHGSSFDATFDLDPASQSSRVLDAYLTEKGYND